MTSLMTHLGGQGKSVPDLIALAVQLCNKNNLFLLTRDEFNMLAMQIGFPLV